MTEPNDPWSNLAETLGATPSQEPTRPVPAIPQGSKPRETRQAREHRPPASTDWGDLATGLGLTEEPRPAERVTVRKPEPEVRAERETASFGGFGAGLVDEPASRGQDREATEPTRTLDAGNRPRQEQEPAGDAEDRGRGRRRRRGGRGRRREGDREPRQDAVGDRDDRGHREGADRGRQREPSGRQEPADRERRAPAIERAAWDDNATGFDAEDRFGAGLDDVRSPSDSPAAQDSGSEGDPGEGERSRPRRRRGRRGGRRRGGTERMDAGGSREPNDGGHPGRRDDVPRTAARDEADEDDELPGGYGVRPRQPRSATGEEGERPATDGEPSGKEDQPGRKRRRRRRSSGRSERETEGGGRRESRSSEPSTSGRRSRRSETASGSSRRSRRDDFSPVSNGRDEDDEGLEFLGLDEATSSTEPHGGRDRPRTEDDELFAETGLDTVRDVPSWVEAIGIVIAGNLDGRSQSGRSSDGGSPPRGGDRGRRDGRGSEPR